MLERAVKWLLSATGERLDPTSVPPEGSGRPKIKKRHLLGTAGAAGAIGGIYVFSKYGVPIPIPAQKAKLPQYPPITTGHMETIQTPFGPKTYMILKPYETTPIQDNNYLRNGTTFMEIGVDIAALHLLYQQAPQLLPHDRTTRYIELWLPNAPKGLTTPNSQTHFISVLSMLINNPFLTNNQPSSQRDLEQFSSLLSTELSIQLLTHLRFSPDELENPIKQSEIFEFQNKIIQLIQPERPLDKPLRAIRFNFDLAQTELQKLTQR